MLSLLNLLCGIGLFLSGMSMMSESTVFAFGEKLKSILARMTKTKISATLTGTAVTGIVQSSTAVTVMTVGFVESQLMNIHQATGIVLGANIGTTVTSLLIAFNFSDFAPVSIFIGAAMMLLAAKDKTKHIGKILLGFGMLFLGLNTMSGSFSHLKENEAFLNLVVSNQGKLTGILVGIIMTAIIQSSSATVCILQALCAQGLVGTESAIYIILGQNIGTVFTSMLSATGKSRSAKQVGMIHLVFNVAGSLIFIAVCEFIPVAALLEKVTNPSMRVSLFHVLFNVITVIMLFPAYELMISISERLTGLKIMKTTSIKRKKAR